MKKLWSIWTVAFPFFYPEWKRSKFLKNVEGHLGHCDSPTLKMSPSLWKCILMNFAVLALCIVCPRFCAKDICIVVVPSEESFFSSCAHGSSPQGRSLVLVYQAVCSLQQWYNFACMRRVVCCHFHVNCSFPHANTLIKSVFKPWMSCTLTTSRHKENHVLKVFVVSVIHNCALSSFMFLFMFWIFFAIVRLENNAAILLSSLMWILQPGQKWSQHVVLNVLRFSPACSLISAALTCPWIFHSNSEQRTWAVWLSQVCCWCFHCNCRIHSPLIQEIGVFLRIYVSQRD